MTYLILAIVTSTLNHLIFKGIARFKIDLLTAIVVNYAVCTTIGFTSSRQTLLQESVFQQSWFPFSVLQGCFLVTCFFLIGLSTRKQGVAITTLATRLSLVIPVAMAFILFSDPITFPKVAGIFTAISALYLSVIDPSKSKELVKSVSHLPIILFIFFGLNTSMMKIVEAGYLTDASYHAYVMFAFVAAFVISATVLGWRIIQNKQMSRWQDLLAGLVLGSVNYGAVYFLIRALSVPGFQSSQVFPTISIAVVIFSALGARLFFVELINKRLITAILIGAGSIILVNL